MRIPSVSGLFIAGYLFDCCHGQRIQTDNIVGETVWSVGDSSFVEIPQDIVVEAQGSLTITEGVQLIFTGRYSIFVQGKVFLNGTEANPITVRNGFKAFSILEVEGNGTAPPPVQAEFEARHTLFADNSGGAIMREWSTMTAPQITVSNCQFQNNEYAVRSYLVQMDNSIIQGGRVGVSLHASTVRNTQIDGLDEICLFSSSESTITNCTISNCGTIGAWIGGSIFDTTIINATEGIAAATGGLGGIVPARADSCVVRGAREVGLKYLRTVTNTVVLDSPSAIGAMVSSGEVSGSIIAGSTIGIQTSNPNGDSATVSITNSYVCGNSEAQFDARLFLGSSSATRTVFGDTAANEDTLGENFFLALPYDSSANGFLQYNLLDTDAFVEPSILEKESIDLETLCGVTAAPSAPLPAEAPTTSQPSMDLALTSAPTESPIQTTPPTIVSLSPTIQASQAPSIETQVETVAATTTLIPSSPPSLMTSSPTQSQSEAPSSFRIQTVMPTIPQTLSQEPSSSTPIQTVAATTTESPTATLVTLMPTVAGTVSQAPASATPTSMMPTTFMTVSQAPSSGVPLTMSPTESGTFAESSIQTSAPTGAIPSSPPPTELPVQKVAPPPKCGSIAGDTGRGGAAAQAKGCASGRRQKQRRLKGR